MSNKKKAYQKCEGCGDYRKTVEAAPGGTLVLCLDCKQLYAEMSDPDATKD